MQSYKTYVKNSVEGFRRLANTDSQIFDRYKSLAIPYLKEYKSSYKDRIDKYKDMGISRIETVFPAKYKWLVSDVNLEALSEVLDNLEDNITDFEGKEDNLKVYVGILFLRFVIVNTMVETLFEAYEVMLEDDTDTNSTVRKVRDSVFSKRLMKYLDPLEDLCSKTRDEWLNCEIDSSTARYFYSTAKRVLSILDNDKM